MLRAALFLFFLFFISFFLWLSVVVVVVIAVVVLLFLLHLLQFFFKQNDLGCHTCSHPTIKKHTCTDMYFGNIYF